LGTTGGILEFIILAALFAILIAAIVTLATVITARQ
jgi:hypothetical protein